MGDLTIEKRLALNHYDVDGEPHIRVETEKCQGCDSHACIYVCPAGCFKLIDGRTGFSYEGCLECGSCRISCDEEAVEWSYPRAGFGISYEFG